MIINGKEMDFQDGITITDLLEKLNLNPNKVVVELNINIIPKEEYYSKTLESNSKVEIIQFVGGGWRKWVL